MGAGEDTQGWRGRIASAVNRRRIFMAAVGLVLSAGFAYLTVERVDLRAVLAAMQTVSLPVLGLSILAKCLGLLMLTVRSQRTTRSVARLPAGPMLVSHLVALAGNNVLPFRLGELLRVDYIARHGQVERTPVLAVIAMERMFDLLVLALIAAVTVPATVADLDVLQSLPLAVGGVVAAFLALALVGRRRTTTLRVAGRVAGIAGAGLAAVVERRLAAFIDGLATMRSVREWFAVLGLTFGYWGFGLVSARLWIAAFGWDLPWYTSLLILVFTSLSMLVPSSPSAVGTYHYATQWALGLVGVSAEMGAAFAIVGHATAVIPLTAVSIVVVGVLAVAGRRQRARDAASSAV